MQSAKFCVVAFLLTLSSAAYVLGADTFANTTLVNGDWKFKRLDPTPTAPEETEAAVDFADSAWEDVSLPHTAHVEPLVANAQWQGVAWYRKHVKTEADWKADDGKKVFIKFEGGMQVADVWVNGKHAVTHFGGYLPFTIDLTDNLAPVGSDNVVAVRVDNRDNADVLPGKPQRRLDFDYYSGLYRNASMRIADRLHITDAIVANKPASGGLFAATTAATPQAATISLQLHALNEYAGAKKPSAHFELMDSAGKIVATADAAPVDLAAGADGTLTAQLNVTNPKLWDPDHPYLYTIKASLLDGQKVVDTVTTRYGIRRIAFSKANGFTINGQHLYLRGADRHQEYPYIGNALSDDAEYRDAVKIKEDGFDFIRLSHYPNSPAFLDACDELGLCVMEPIPGWQNLTKTALFSTRAVENVRDMIRRDRNHPSVILWETSLNETGENQLIPLLQAAGRQEFGTMAPDQFFTEGWATGFDVFMQARQHKGLHGYNGTTAAGIDEYGDWEYYSNNPGFNQEDFKDLKQADRSSRHSRGDSELLQLQQAVNFQESANDNRSTVAFGDCVWVMFDYSRGYAKDLEMSGPMDSLRLPKLSYYFYQSQRDPVALSDVKDVVTGPMVFIATYWTKESPLDVRVYSNCDEVELFQDGKSLGRQKPDTDKLSTRLPHPPFSFKVAQFTPGTLKAVGYIKGHESASYTVKSPEAAATIRLRVDTRGKALKADGSDCVFVYADILDANGTVVPSAKVPVTLTVKSGDAHIVGGKVFTAESGISGFLLQGGKTAGSIELQATAEALKDADLKLDSQKP